MLTAIGLEGVWCRTRCCDTTLSSWGGEEGGRVAPVPKPQLLVPLYWAPLNILWSRPLAKSSLLKKVPVNSVVLPCKYLSFA